jgi:hypothetical protein
MADEMSADFLAQANEIDLEDIAITEEASQAWLEQLKNYGVEPSIAFVDTKAKWTDEGELILYYKVRDSESSSQGHTIVMQIPADHWTVDIQQTYLH